MELTKEQIQEIDNHLKSCGIKYWDLRIEMIDHIVSDIETNAKSKDFKKELILSLKRIGWLGNLFHINTEGWQNVNRKYRKEYHKGIIDFFKSFKNIFFLIIAIGGYYWFSEIISFKTFIRISMFLFCIPVFYSFFAYFKNFKKKYGKSVNLDYGMMYLTLSVLILQSFPILFDEQSETFQRIMWFIVLTIHFLAFKSGYSLYKKSIAKVEQIKKELSL